MPAPAEIFAATARTVTIRTADLPTCPVCVDTMVAAEASAFDANDQFVSHLWVCETCGYGFVTRHALNWARSH